MFLTKKKKIKLLDFKERIIKTKGFYGEDIELRAIKNSIISDYEILIPKYGITYDSVCKQDDGYVISFIGYGGIIPLEKADLMNATDSLKERFRSTVGSSIAVYIYIDRAFKLQQVEYHYLYKGKENTINCDFAKAMLYNYDISGKNPDILMSTNYID